MAEKKPNQEEELVPVGMADRMVPEEDEVHEESEERPEEERAEGGEAEDERVGQGREEDEDGDDREEIRKRRRAEKQRKKENRNRDRIELNFLRQRNENLERRQSELDSRVANGEMIQIDNKISELSGQIREAENLKALALSKGDGNSAVEADRIINDLRSGRDHLVGVKNHRQNAAVVAAREPPKMDPLIQAKAKEWASRHDWYDTNLRTPDSRVAKAVEESLFVENKLDPRTDEYWDELDRRMKKYLPHQFNGRRTEEVDDRDERDEDDGETEEQEDTRQERKPRGPQVRVGGRERSLKKNEVYITAERKEAMIEAGVWADPVLRERYLKQYQKYDRDNRRR